MILMPRRKENLNKGIFHLYNKTLKNKVLFKDNKDYFFFINKIINLKKEYNINIIAFLLMPEHYHLIIDKKLTYKSFQLVINPYEKNISKFMARLQLAYTKYYNHKYKNAGYLFSGRFKSYPINNDINLQNLILYIHTEPHKKKLIKKDDIWSFSSEKNYLTKYQSKIIDTFEPNLIHNYNKLKETYNLFEIENTTQLGKLIIEKISL